METGKSGNVRITLPSRASARQGNKQGELAWNGEQVVLHHTLGTHECSPLLAPPGTRHTRLGSWAGHSALRQPSSWVAFTSQQV